MDNLLKSLVSVFHKRQRLILSLSKLYTHSTYMKENTYLYTHGRNLTQFLSRSQAASATFTAEVRQFYNLYYLTNLYIHQLFLPLTKRSETLEKSTMPASPPPSPVEAPSVSVAGVSVEEIVSRVLKSKELEVLITSISQDTVKNQPATEDIHFIVK